MEAGLGQLFRSTGASLYAVEQIAGGETVVVLWIILAILFTIYSLVLLAVTVYLHQMVRTHGALACSARALVMRLVREGAVPRPACRRAQRQSPEVVTGAAAHRLPSNPTTDFARFAFP
jgi:hypothetical protein